MPEGGPDDKLTHALIFMALAVAGRWAQVPPLALGLGLVAYAGLTEVLQAVLPIDRDGDVRDLLADATGDTPRPVPAAGWLSGSVGPAAPSHSVQLRQASGGHRQADDQDADVGSHLSWARAGTACETAAPHITRARPADASGRQPRSRSR